MPKRDYSSKKYDSLAEAYNAYWDDRHTDTENPTIISQDKFARIWGWEKPKSGKPGKTGLMAGEKGPAAVAKKAKSAIAKRNVALKEAMRGQ